ncbi:MAG: TlpA disulfide reductase family protein [Blastocatellia bacterium]
MLRLTVRRYISYMAVAGLASVALSMGTAVAQRSAASRTDPISGRWDAALEVPSGPVAFGLDLNRRGSVVRGHILNGPERMALSTSSFDGTTVVLRLDEYDGRITAKFEDAAKTKLVGQYQRQTRSGIGTYRFVATRAARPAAKPAFAAAVDASMEISGDWIITIRDPKSSSEEVSDATFTVKPSQATPGAGEVTGTIIPVSGDYGLLAGMIRRDPSSGGAVLRMSRFDGIHVVKIEGRVETDGSLSGTLSSGLSFVATWKATRKERTAAGEPKPGDPYSLTRVKDPSAVFSFSLPDSRGGTVSLADERFRGKVVLIDIMGTWCPNCHDSAPLLADLHRRYRSKGLEVVMLAYEYTPDAARNARQIDIFRKKYGIEFPILMAGTTADGEIARTLPQLEGFGAYPTTIFVGRDGRVRRIHAGFSGPATGERHTHVKREFESLVRELLDAKP